jgi:hypothetical protein
MAAAGARLAERTSSARLLTELGSDLLADSMAAPIYCMTSSARAT